MTSTALKHLPGVSTLAMLFHTCRKSLGVLSCIGVGLGVVAAGYASEKHDVHPRQVPLVDDRNISVSSRADVQETRAALIELIWGVPGFPASKLPDEVRKDVRSTVDNLTNLKRVDDLIIKMEAGEETVAHHFIPTVSNDRLVILHHGHGCNLNDAMLPASFGLAHTIDALLKEGFSVLGMYMPHYRPGNCAEGDGFWDLSHQCMFGIDPDTQPDHQCKPSQILTVQHGHVMKFFVEPVAVGLNYLETSGDFPVYRSFDMVGLSGGGWTTTLYAALDPRIQISIPVAGTVPLYMRQCKTTGSECISITGDEEQTSDVLFSVAGYLDLYVLGAQGVGRKQIQILNRHDDCCFGEAHYEKVVPVMDAAGNVLTWDMALADYEDKVRRASADMNAISYELVIDEVATRHEISASAVVNTILPALARRDTTADGGRGRCRGYHIGR